VLSAHHEDAARGLAARQAGGAFVSEQERLASLVRSGSLLLVLGTFFGWDCFLGFTPCVLPMVPILSGIIVGQARASNPTRFLLSLTYVLAWPHL